MEGEEAEQDLRVGRPPDARPRSKYVIRATESIIQMAAEASKTKHNEILKRDYLKGKVR